MRLETLPVGVELLGMLEGRNDGSLVIGVSDVVTCDGGVGVGEGM